MIKSWHTQHIPRFEQQLTATATPHDARTSYVPATTKMPSHFHDDETSEKSSCSILMQLKFSHDVRKRISARASPSCSIENCILHLNRDTQTPAHMLRRSMCDINPLTDFVCDFMNIFMSIIYLSLWWGYCCPFDSWFAKVAHPLWKIYRILWNYPEICIFFTKSWGQLDSDFYVLFYKMKSRRSATIWRPT